jgi:hypothetical protein
MLASSSYNVGGSFRSNYAASLIYKLPIGLVGTAIT